MPKRKQARLDQPVVQTDDGLASRMRRCLAQALADAETDVLAAPLPDPVAEACRSLVTSGRENGRLAALTVIAATAADNSIAPDIIQVSAGGSDFRSLYKTAIRPGLLAIAEKLHARWQPSSDPFVSNPFREPAINVDWVLKRQNKFPGAEALLVIVSHVATHRADASAVLFHLVTLEQDLLARSAITYQIPPRLRTSVVIDIVERWLAGDSGGRRHESISVALLRFAGQYLLDGWTAVESHNVNDPAPYDALCKAGNTPILVAQVKAQPLTADHVRQLAVQLDLHQAKRGYLFTRAAFLPASGSDEQRQLEDMLRNQDGLGRRIDVLDIVEATRLWLPLLDQNDTRLPAFVRLLADELDNHATPSDRRALAALLEQL